jgi:beta-glucosidase
MRLSFGGRQADMSIRYNKVDGVFCSEHTSLIQNILREEWGYRGCSISDWYGTHSCIPAIMAGLDLEMPGPSVFRGAKLVEAVKNGRLNQTVLDDRVANVLKLVEQTKSSHSTAPEESLFDESANQLAKQVGMEGIILLQNRNSILPLVGSERLAIIGAAATAPPISGGGSAAAPPQYVKCPADFIKALHSQPDFVETSAGVMVHVTIPTVSQELIFAHDGKNGVDVRYFNDGDITPVLEESQPLPEVVMLGQIKPGLKADAFSYEITTTLIPRTTGLHTIGIQATGSFVLKINGENVSALQKISYPIPSHLPNIFPDPFRRSRKCLY